jgi:hypothetical protein
MNEDRHVRWSKLYEPLFIYRKQAAFISDLHSHKDYAVQRLQGIGVSLGISYSRHRELIPIWTPLVVPSSALNKSPLFQLFKKKNSTQSQNAAQNSHSICSSPVLLFWNFRSTNKYVIFSTLHLSFWIMLTRNWGSGLLKERGEKQVCPPRECSGGSWSGGGRKWVRLRSEMEFAIAGRILVGGHERDVWRWGGICNRWKNLGRRSWEGCMKMRWDFA